MNGGYPNGYGNDYGQGRYGYNGTSDSYGYGGYSNSSGNQSRDRRPGGYGGIPSPGRQSPSPSRTREYRRSADRERNWDSSRSRSRPAGPGGAVRKIEEVLEYIKREWPFMTEDNCVPVSVALQLLDDSSLGLANRDHEFHDTQKQLHSSLRAIVNEHHQGFNSSIGTYHQIQTSIQSSQQRIRDLKDSLVDAKSNLTSTKLEYQNLSSSSQNFGAMIDVLGTIETVQQIPEQLEARISEKRFLTAVDSLQEALALIRRPELDNIGALSDMRVYLSNQEHSLTDILVEELHNHLYLKSPYCEDRWTQYTKQQEATGAVTGLNLDSGPRQLYSFLDQLDTSSPMVDDSSRNPEADSFQYIYLITEALAKLGRMDDAVDAIEQRLPVELFRVVERTNGEVQQRHQNTNRANLNASSSTFDLLERNEAREVVLDDLLGTLFARFEAIAEAHRVLHDTITGIARRQGIINTTRLTRGFKELWKLYQSEMRSLLHDYLSTDGSDAYRMQNRGEEGNIFRYQRDKNKKCTFKMEWLDSNDPELKIERDEIVGVWQKFVPGLVSLNQTNKSGTNTANGYESSGTGHKLLVDPSVFNISSLLPPSVSFLKRLREVVPPGSDIVISTLTSFLNDFLINVFHPQLEETLTDLCSESFMQLDAFQQDPQWVKYSQKPIFRGTSKFIEIISAFCRMLGDLTHDQLFTQLVIKQIDSYYDKCNAWYKALVSRADPGARGQTLKASAAYAETGDISDATQKLWDAMLGEGDINEAVEAEKTRLLDIVEREPLELSDMIPDSKTQASLCLLYTSMRWLAARLSQLRYISDRATNTSGINESDEKPQLKRSLTTALPAERTSEDEGQAYLPLSQETAGLFDGIVSAFEDLASGVLRTLHLEIRCSALYTISQSVSGAFLPDVDEFDAAADAPDEQILQLVTDLLEFSNEVSLHLQATEKRFIFRGAAHLVDDALVRQASNSVTALNLRGNTQLQLSARVLYHNLLNVEPDADLPRAFGYFALFAKGPDGVMEAARDNHNATVKFGKDELFALLKLWYSEGIRSESREDVMRAKKSLDDRLAQLSAIFDEQP